MSATNNWNHNVRLHQAAAIVAAGGVIAYPTEAVWGLGCDPDDAEAVGRILALKHRQWTMGMILVAAEMDQLAPYLEGLSAEQLAQLEQTWPGPVTWLVPDNGVAGSWITGGRPTLALRVSAHPLVAALCRIYGGPIVSTSANPHGKPPARTGIKVRSYFGRGVDAITPGAVGGAAKPTEIRELLTGVIHRKG